MSRLTAPGGIETNLFEECDHLVFVAAMKSEQNKETACLLSKMQNITLMKCSNTFDSFASFAALELDLSFDSTLARLNTDDITALRQQRNM